MTPDEYQKAALRTAKPGLSIHDALTEGVLGLTGECGECVDMVKKCVFQGHTLSSSTFAEELGDVCWYVALLADCLRIPLNEILEMNVKKLRARYPDGFDEARSICRNDTEWQEQE